MNKTIKIAQEFSRYPAGRFQKDGPYSGELFRQKFLEPALSGEKTSKIIIEMDGARGYGSSFLEEAFGGLVRRGFEKEQLKNRLEIHATNSSLKLEILDYIDKALPVPN
ncbi:STAS-like domain-containing protein [Herbaspirillum sp. C7C8]|uniref:STAS-like domain-containing protein n=1 Tax=Herbaspirillum sp. C7C8 TaxID=2736665 RepID=UPI001F51C692|nr:STAS-like domain-containing protein [Herbaspirillum sp. C7C8]MCI1005194.1 STAS-like domain-containing protein [Herbaspirillum sp. C7C8]